MVFGVTLWLKYGDLKKNVCIFVVMCGIFYSVLPRQTKKCFVSIQIHYNNFFMKNTLFNLVLVVATLFGVEAAAQNFQLTKGGYFKNAGVDVMAFDDIYPEGPRAVSASL